MNPPSPAGRPAASPNGTWPTVLAAVLLLALAVGAAARWSSPPQAREEIVQIPVPDATPTQKEELTAPDPGDNP